jgi:trehalose 2-sulfotransferase
MAGLLRNLRHPRHCYVVCAVARSGSNLLTDALRETGRAGQPKQFFSELFQSGYGAKYGLDPGIDYARYVRGVLDATATSNGVFGFKLMGWSLEGFLARLRGTGQFASPDSTDLDVLRSAFPRLQFIRIIRRDKLRQAISKARAMQTGLWKLADGKNAVGEAHFDRDLIAQCLREGEIEEAAWDRFFENFPHALLTIEYDQLSRDYKRTVKSVLDFLGIALQRGSKIGEPITVKQSDAISDEWERRYRTTSSATVAVR